MIGTFSRDLAEVNLLLLDREFLGGLGLGRPGKEVVLKINSLDATVVS